MYTLIKFCTYIILITRGNQKRKFSLRKITHPAVIWWFSGLIYARFTPAREKIVLSSETIRFKTCFEQSTYFCCKFSLTRYDIFFWSHWLYWLLRFGFKDTHLKCALIQLIVLGFCISTVIVHIFFFNSSTTFSQHQNQNKTKINNKLTKMVSKYL